MKDASPGAFGRCHRRGVPHARRAPPTREPRCNSCATEAINALNGVGIVKLMGRDAGFIAAAATLASREVNDCLIPEVPFELEGPNGQLADLERRLQSRRHALIVVAEGCAKGLAGPQAARDPSENLRYASKEPLAAVSGRHKQVNPDGSLWLAVTEATGQPPLR